MASHSLNACVPSVKRFDATEGCFCCGGAIVFSEDASLAGEAYTLTITPTTIHVGAGTPLGRFRAETTLRQLLKAGTIPCGHLYDAPDKTVRGVMLDVSRNRIYTLETLKWFVDCMVELKLNRLELYFENVFAYTQHPTAWANTTPYTAEEMRTLSAYCHERFIELVPNQNTLGHFERWLKADETYRRYFELPQGGARTPWGSIQTVPTGLCTTDPDVVNFTQGLLDELLPNFPYASTANLGGDEVFDLGQGRSAGKGTPTDLYLNYMEQMATTAQRHGLRTELWADMLLRHPDMLETAATRLPDVTWLLWGYEATDPLVAQAERLRVAGLSFSVAPGTSSWRSFCGRVTNMEANIRTAAAIDCEGILLTDWGDAGHWQPFVVTLPAVVLMAAQAWNADAPLDWATAIDTLTECPGLGEFLLQLGRTADRDPVKVGNATRLFRDYNLPWHPLPEEEQVALAGIRDELNAMAPAAHRLGDSLLAREARLAWGLQQLAVNRALGMPNLSTLRQTLAEEMRTLWFARGKRGQWDNTLADLLAPELP